MRLAITLVVVLVPLFAAGSRLDNGIELERAGKLKDADRELRAAIAELSGAGDRANLLRALSAESWVSVSLGNNADGIRQATEALRLRQELHDQTGLTDDLNTLALAHQNLGEYGVALDFFNQALSVDRKNGDAEGEVSRLINIGAVHYYQGQYIDALRFYEQAKRKVDANSSAPWYWRRLQLAVANLATVYQRLGQEEKALELYRGLAASPQAMPPREYAQLQLNEGVLYRRLGDPVKALELYRSAQKLYVVDRYTDGEIGALRNTGIVLAMDMQDLRGALDAFDAARKLAEESSNRRGMVQASLYRSEALRRLHRLKEAAADAQAGLDGAKQAGLVEDQWRALYILGRIAQDAGDGIRARQYYSDAIAQIESIRAGLRTATLRNDFLADKREVYDTLIGLRLSDGAPAGEVFELIERSRARTLGERVSLGPFQDLHAIQSRLSPESTVLDVWMGADSSATVWITSSQSGIVVHRGSLEESAAKAASALESGADAWRDVSRELGETLLRGIPLSRHLIVVPDGSLNAVPFEALAEPGSAKLLVEKADVSYLPSAQFLARQPAPRRTLLPWQRQFVMLGDPPVENAAGLDEQWQRLGAAADEARSIEQILPGRSEIHLGADAQKRHIEGPSVENLPVLHFSTHALVDPENPDRSRILLASGYIFQGEAYSLDLKGVDLVTVSACDTARGKRVGGEGVQAFSRAFLAAGANSTVTSLWRVADEPAAAFMKQFYYFLARGQSKAEALRSAKMAMLNSGSGLGNPRHWAAFVLTGNGLTPVPRTISWSVVLLSSPAILVVVLVIVWAAVRAARPKREMAESLTA